LSYGRMTGDSRRCRRQGYPSGRHPQLARLTGLSTTSGAEPTTVFPSSYGQRKEVIVRTRVSGLQRSAVVAVAVVASAAAAGCGTQVSNPAASGSPPLLRLQSGSGAMAPAIGAPTGVGPEFVLRGSLSVGYAGAVTGLVAEPGNRRGGCARRNRACARDRPRTDHRRVGRARPRP